MNCTITVAWIFDNQRSYQKDFDTKEAAWNYLNNSGLLTHPDIVFIQVGDQIVKDYGHV